MTRLLVLITVLATSTTVKAATYYWDNNGTTAGFGTAAGTWDNTAGSLWSTSSTGVLAPGAFTTTLDALNFGNGTNLGIVAGTVTVSGTVDAGSLTFASGSGAVVLSGGTINMAAASTITVNNATNTINSVLAGAATSLTKNGTGTLVLTGVNTYAGTTIINAGTISLTGVGTISASTGLTFNGGALTITNTNAADALLNRVNDSAPVISNGGTFTFTNTSSANVYTETIGTVALTTGQMNFNLATNQAGAGSQTLTLSGLTQAGTAGVTFSAASTAPNATKNMIVVSGAAATAAGQIIGPWATTGTTAAAQTDYAVYNASSQVIPRAIAASAQTTWIDAANAYTNSTAAVTLTATRTIAALRNTGATTVLTLANGANLETYGLLNGVTTLMTVAPGTGGVLTTPTGGGNLFVTTGSGAITISAPINDNGGAVTLVLGGSGTLTLSSTTSNFSGGIVVNGGTLTAAVNTNLGAASNGITLNGSASIGTGSVTYARAITLNNGATATFVSNTSSTWSGNLTGSGGLAMNSGFGSQVFFTGSANTFEGPVTIGSTGTTGQAYRFAFSSFVDSPTAKGGITFTANAVTHGDGSVFQYQGVTNLTISNRVFEIASTGARPTNGHQIRNNGTGSATLTIDSDLVVSSQYSQALSLGGSSTGVSTFAGIIGDSPRAVVGSTALAAAYAAAASTVTLSSIDGIAVGATISGTGIAGGTTITAINTTTRVVTLSTPTSAANTVNQAMTIAGVVNNTSLIKADAGTWNLTATNTYTGSTTINAGTLQITGAGSLGAGSYGGRIVNSGTLVYASSADQTFSGIISGTGALTKNTSSTSVLTLASGASSFSGAVTVTTGTLVAAASATSGSTSALGQAVNTRTITIGSGATLRFDLGNVLSGNFGSTGVPTLAVTNGTVVNNFANNNALNNVTLNDSTLTATAGSATYGAFNINGTVTSTGSSLISSSEPVNGRMSLSTAGTVFNVTGNLTISAPLAGVAREAILGGFTKSGAGTLLLTGANTYSGFTTVTEGTLTVGTGGTLGGGTAALTVNGATTIVNLATAVDTSVGSLSGTDTSTINTGGIGRNFTIHQTIAGSFAGVIAGNGNLILGNRSTNALTLTGTQNYTGSTTVLAGTLVLDYSVNNTSKLSDTAALTFGGGTIDLSGGTHTEEVASTSLIAGTASRVTSSSPGSVIRLKAITASLGASIDFATTGIATTDTNNINGILGTWATVGGTDWATNSTDLADGPITAYAGYVDVPRLTPGTITNGSTTNVRIIEGSGSAGNITLGSVVTTIYTLNQSVSGGASSATIDPSGKTLRTNAILSATGAGALTILAGGTLSTATPGGDLAFNNNSINALTIDSVIANNTTASSLSKAGSGVLILSAANTYTGATVVTAGTLNLTGSITGSAITVNGSGVLLESTTGIIGGASSITFASTGTSTLSGANTHTGGTTVSNGNLILGHASALGTGAFTLSGGSFDTDGFVTSLANNNALIWNASFTYGGASALNLGTGAITLNANTQVTVSANTLTVNGVISGAFGIAKAGAGTLILNAANIHSGGTTITGNTSAGTLVLGNAGALGTGPFTINGNSTINIDSSIPNLVNANNNVQNWQASFTFVGTENFNLGTGAVTMLGNRTVTVSNNTLTIGGGIGGAYNFTKSGPGTMVLSGVNTYSGTTTINAGTLRITGAGSLGGGNYAGAITNNATFIHDSSAAQTLGGVISGSGSLTKSGLGNLTLSGANTYGGSTTIGTGTLIVTAAGTLGSAPVVDIASGTMLRFIDMTAVLTTLAGTYTGSGTLALAGTGAANSNLNQYGNSATLTGFTGTIDIQGARLAAATQTGLGGVSAISATNGGQLFASGAGPYTTPLTISGTGWAQENQTAQGAPLGALRLATGTYSGPITLSGNASIIAHGSTGILTGVIGETGGARVLTLGGSNLASVTTLTLAPVTANTYTGGTIIDHAVVNANANGAFGTGTVTLQTTGTTFVSQVSRIVVADGVNIPNAIVLAGPSIFGVAGVVGPLTGPATGTGTFSGPITINASVSAGGHINGGNLTGGLVLSGPIVASVPFSQRGNRATFSGGGTYATVLLSGERNFDQTGTTVIGANNGLAMNAVVNVAVSGAGTVDLNGFNQEIAGLIRNSTQTAIVTNSSATLSTLTINVPATFNQVYSGTITANLTLVKSGSGSQALSGVNTYTGNTAVNAGMLILTGNGSIATSPTITVAAAAIYDVAAVTGGYSLASGQTLQGLGTVTGPVTVASGATIRGDSASGTGGLTTGNLNVAGGGTIFTNLGVSGTSSRLLIGANTLDLSVGGTNSTLSLASVVAFDNTQAGSWIVAQGTSGASYNVNALPQTSFGQYIQGSGPTGSVTINPGLIALTTGDTFELVRSGDNLVLNFSPVPEPGMIGLIAAAAAGLGWRFRRRSSLTAS